MSETVKARWIVLGTALMLLVLCTAAVVLYLAMPRGPRGSASRPAAAAPDAPSARPPVAPPPAPPEEKVPKASLVEVRPDSLVLSLADPAEKPGRLECELYELGGQLLARTAQDHDGRPAQVALKAELRRDDLVGYYIRFRFRAAQEFHRQSLLHLGHVLETTLLCRSELVPGRPALFRVLVHNHGDRQPLAGATVKTSLVRQGQELASAQTATQLDGQAYCTLDLPDLEMDDAVLQIDVSTRLAQDRIRQGVRLRRRLQTLLAADQPSYQPGQTIGVRSLSLDASTLAAAGGVETLLEILDPRGNRLLRQAGKTDPYGLASACLPLAQTATPGRYLLRLTQAGATQEKVLVVDGSPRPQVRLELSTDRSYYQPAQTVAGVLRAIGPDALPLPAAQVALRCVQVDGSESEVHRSQGKTDAEGIYRFELKLAHQFAPAALEANRAAVRVEATVTDPAGSADTLVRSLPVATAPILLTVAAEAGLLVPDLENRLHLAAAYVDGTAAPCELTLMDAQNRPLRALRTDAAGYAEIAYRPRDANPARLVLLARDAQGHLGRLALDLACRPGGPQVLLRTDRSLARVGEKLKLSVSATHRTGPIFVDVLRAGRTVLTRTLELREGQAEEEILLTPAMGGMIEVVACRLEPAGPSASDRRLLFVEPANDLRVTVKSDQASYAPGAEARLEFRVTDALGKGLPAALGVHVAAPDPSPPQTAGSDKMFFYLRRELALPGRSLPGWTLEQCLSPRAGEPPARQAALGPEAAARILLAGASEADPAGLVHVNSYLRDNRDLAYQQRVARLIESRLPPIADALNRYGEQARARQQAVPEPVTLGDLVREKLLEPRNSLDPWGTPMQIGGEWCPNCRAYHGFWISSAGVDAQAGTGDDLRFPPDKPLANPLPPGAPPHPPAPAPAPPPAPPAPPPRLATPRTGPTLLFEPALITDAEGAAALTLRLGEAVGRWDLAARAHSADGRFGTAGATLRAERDFTVDLHAPPSLTRGDHAGLPVRVVSHARARQEVRLTLEPQPWYELLGSPEQTVRLEAGESKTVHFPLTARQAGRGRLQLSARGGQAEQTLGREIEVHPDGNQTRLCQSGIIEGHTKLTLQPAAGATPVQAQVKIYPSPAGQLKEALEDALRLPPACLEDVLAGGWMNVLLLENMQANAKGAAVRRPACQAELRLVLQRLLAYEVEGGFDWLGKGPADRAATAWTLMLLQEMASHVEVDAAILARVRGALLAGQMPDGAWPARAAGGSEAPAQAPDPVATLRMTALTVWALAAGGEKGEPLTRARAFLAERLSGTDDPYALAVGCHALAALRADDEALPALLRKLAERTEDREAAACWPCPAATPSLASGPAGEVETTALAVQALLRANVEPPLSARALRYLAQARQAHAGWGATQATVQALRALRLAQGRPAPRLRADIQVLLNGKHVARIQIEPDDDAPHAAALDLPAGQAEIKIIPDGQLGQAYQVLGRYAQPSDPLAGPEDQTDQPMSLNIEYDRTEAELGQTLAATATLTCNRTGSIPRVALELAAPPGFVLVPESIEQAVQAGRIDKALVRGERAVLYVRELSRGRPVRVDYTLRAVMPARTRSAPCEAWQVGNAACRAAARPATMTVRL